MNQDKTIFSIVVPTYNRAWHISKTIGSVLNQSYQDYELIIVDDGSTDNTEELVRKFEDQRIHYFRIKNSERGAARNHGIFHSKGQYITFLDSDDLLKPQCLETAMSFITKYDSPPVFHIGYDIVDETGRIITPWKPLPDRVNDKLIEGNYLSCMGIFVQRDVFDTIRFNESRTLAGSEDYELWLRLAARYDIRTCPASTALLINHRQRSVVTANTTQLVNRINMLKESLAGDAEFVRRFGHRLDEFYAYLGLYTALHLIMDGDRGNGVRAWMSAWIKYPFLIFKFRFWVVVKKIIVG